MGRTKIGFGVAGVWEELAPLLSAPLRSRPATPGELSRITCLTEWVKPLEVGVFGNTTFGLSKPPIPFHHLSAEFIQCFRRAVSVSSYYSASVRLRADSSTGRPQQLLTSQCCRHLQVFPESHKAEISEFHDTSGCLRVARVLTPNSHRASDGRISCCQAVDNWVERFISNIQILMTQIPRSPDSLVIGQWSSVDDLGPSLDETPLEPILYE